MIDSIKEAFKRKEMNFYVYVKEYKSGIITEVNPKIQNLHPSQKEQIKTFLGGIIEWLK